MRDPGESGVVKPSAQLVLDILTDAQGLRPVCASTFLRHSMARYGARIFELRKLGYKIERSVCRVHEHPHGPIYQYRLVDVPAGAFV